MKPGYIKKIQAKSRDLTVLPMGLDSLVVESRSDDTHNHMVKVQFSPDGEVRTACTCAWAKYHGVACSHTMAALEHLAARKGRSLSFWLSEDDARRQKQRIFYMVNERNPDDGVWITSRAG
ncbi:MAG: SWIM zinc finger family protein [Chloroflexota bacterium]